MVWLCHDLFCWWQELNRKQKKQPFSTAFVEGMTLYLEKRKGGPTTPGAEENTNERLDRSPGKLAPLALVALAMTQKDFLSSPNKMYVYLCSRRALVRTLEIVVPFPRLRLPGGFTFFKTIAPFNLALVRLISSSTLTVK